MPTKEEDILQAWGAFFESHALAVKRIEQELQGKSPLTLDEYDVLLVLSRSAGGRMRLSALADATVFTRSGITRIFKRLEERRYLRREECSEDKRGAFAVITSSGRDALHATWKHYSRAILEIFEPCLTQSEARAFTEMHERIVGALRNSPLVQIAGGKR